MHVQILANLICYLGAKQPPSAMEIHGKWAEMLCKQQKVPNAGAAGVLATMAICLHPAPKDLDVGQRIAKELRSVIGTPDMDAINSSAIYPIICLPTRSNVGGLLLQHVETCLTDVEWVVAMLKLEPSGIPPEVSKTLGPELSRSKQEEMLHARMEALVLLVSRFVEMSLQGKANNLLKQVLLPFLFRHHQYPLTTIRLDISKVRWPNSCSRRQ